MSKVLHQLEARLLSVLKEKGSLIFEELVSETRLNQDQVRRSIEWLSAKGYVNVGRSIKRKIILVQRELPELKLYELLIKGPLRLPEAKKEFKTEKEFSAAIGRAKASGWAEVRGKGDDAVIEMIDKDKPSILRDLINLLELSPNEEEISNEKLPLLSDLIRRGIAKVQEEKIVKVEITKDGLDAISSFEKIEYIDRLTPEIITSGLWRAKRLRPIDVEAPPPRFYPGRIHPVREFIREIKEVYLSMGFAEVRGENIQPAFWNFDALFTPQDHPGRELQDTFYIKDALDTNIRRTGVVENVAAVHENGWITGSRGWGYKWSLYDASRLVLRTHNTVLSVRALFESKGEEVRLFSVGKVYRNENLDYKHLAELHQTDGIIAGKDLNVKHLIGFLTEFYKKLGMSGVKVWPTYFPYTEPSLQVMAYSDKKKAWIEMGGSGIFRPEVTWPLGVRFPVLAWGLGIERLIMLRLNLEDIREIYGNDLNWLRNRSWNASSQTRA